MAIIISVLALLATFSQSYLQWVHNQKSVKPLGQIDLRDRDGQMFVAISNNGVGPLIIDNLTFYKDGKPYQKISDCLTIDVKNFNQLVVAQGIVKVVAPCTQLQIFEIKFLGTGQDSAIERLRRELSCLNLKVACKDIYDKQIFLERSLHWFNRNSSKSM